MLSTTLKPVLFVISFSISKSCIFCRRLFQWFKAIKLIIQHCKFRKALEIVEIQRNARCKSKAAFFALSSNPHSWIFASVTVGSNPPPIHWYLRYSSNTCSHCNKEWHRSMTDAAQLRSVAETAPKSAFYFWTKSLSDMVFMPAQELSIRYRVAHYYTLANYLVSSVFVLYKMEQNSKSKI